MSTQSPGFSCAPKWLIEENPDRLFGLLEERNDGGDLIQF